MPMPSSFRDRDQDKFQETSDGKTSVRVTSFAISEGLLFEQASSTVLYLAEGLFGALPSEAKWKIKKIDLSSGVQITSASAGFDQIWNDRAALNYV